MSKMFWELLAPLQLASARENMGVNDIYKYLRYYRLFTGRYNWELEHEGEKINLTKRIESILFWNGVVAIVKDEVYGLIVCQVEEKTIKANPNGFPTTVDVRGEGGYKGKNLKVGKDVILLYSDSTNVAPVLYIWAVANNIITREDIINQQDNMLRKPILITGEGEDLDNAMATAENVLSGVKWLNLNPKRKNKSNIMLDKTAEVLNLQVGNSYKGGELWDSRRNFEELILDYLGYVTVKNEKRERMNTTEVNKGNSVANAFYKEATGLRKKCVEEIKRVFNESIKFTENIERKEESENGSIKNNMDKTIKE